MNMKRILQDLKDRKITPEQARELMSGNQNGSLTTGVKEKEPIAIVGISGRYPGADNMNQYWNNLVEGKNSIREIPSSRWDMNQYYDPQIGKEGHIYCKWMGMLEEVECFDPLFFEITPSDAEAMDPQHRLFLQEAYHAFEDAGYSKKKLDNTKCGVYLGIVDDDYSSLGEMSLSATGNSNAIGASRISYFLNLKGPAIAIDTACSSSMVGVHLAVNALKMQEIDMALVGGACLYLTPESYISMCETGMLSPEGKCKTFDNSADGFVPGEGIGALVLKRLSDAKRDHDHIYGCIIASGMNQDGKTNGITAPNMGSQQDLETALYDENTIMPESITYAEFHGTGTKLGDPIELQALASAFREKTDKKQFCAIGSVKSNLGHTSATGGIAGIEKILLCMKHKELVPTILVNTPNEHFDFENSPFVINKEVKPWKNENHMPLRACISSFGFSGTNVHVVLEEYQQAQEKRQSSRRRDQIFTLSARNKNQLKIYAQQMLEFLSEEIACEEDFFYTMQDCREAMEARLAIVVSGIEELKEKLLSYLKNGSDENKLILESKLSKNQIKLKETAYAMQQKAGRKQKIQMRESVTQDDMVSLAKDWLSGTVIDWVSELYEGDTPYKMSLPTYPFEKEAYWLSKGEKKKSAVTLHPIVHQNISDFETQCFLSEFTGKEFFFEDHVVKNRKILPGAAMLEMARAAGSLASDRKVTRLQDIVWTSELDYDKTEGKVKINLYPCENEKTFTISQADYEVVVMQGQTQVICSEGKISYEAIREERSVINVEALQKKCTKEVDVTQFYQNVAKSGIQYGSSFQAIKKLFCKEEEAYAVLSLQESAKEEQLELNPALLDAAMQTVSVILGETTKGTILPFSIQNVVLYEAIPEQCFVYAKRVGSMLFELCICRMDGTCVVKIEELYLKEVKTKDAFEKTCDLAYFTPEWKDGACSSGLDQNDKQQALVVVSSDEETNTEWKRALEENRNNHVFFVIKKNAYQQVDRRTFQCNISKKKDWVNLLVNVREQGYTRIAFTFPPVNQKSYQNANDRIQAAFESILHLGKALIEEKWTNEIPLVYFVQDEPVSFPEDSALAGMFRGIQTENEGFMFRIVGTGNQVTMKDYITILKQELRLTEPSCQVRYRNGKREVNRFTKLMVSQENKDTPFIKENGTYLITGGMGGVGYLTAEYVAATKHVHVILTGRSPLDETKKKRVEALIQKGCDCEYLQMDVTKKDECKKAIAYVEKKYGSLSGVFHSAGVIRDAMIWKKTMEEANAVYEPKIVGTKNLDEAIGNRAIDFMILYSSIASALGNIGQTDYCYGNSFMDHFSENRNLLVKVGLRKGRTVSINWPLWEEGGMEIDEESRLWMKNSLGLVPIPSKKGMEALETAFHSGKSQVMVFHGDVQKVCTVIEHVDDKKKDSEKAEASVEKGRAIASDKEWKEKAIDYMTEIIADKTKIKKERLDIEEAFGDYGVDSILVLSITRSLEKTFGSLPKTIFFEYGTIQELAEYFLTHHTEKLVQAIGKATQNDAKEADSVEESKRRVVRPAKKVEVSETKNESESSLKGCSDIAIIGISGKYPMADDLHEFWSNLVEGKDCITEIPKERWDHNQYFDADKNKLGTTYSKWGGFIRDVDKFDPLFFHIPPVEAEFLDPQVRLYLESAWHAMEDAGYTRESLASQKVGVYVGVMYGMYQLYNGEMKNQVVPASSSYAGIANRVSYFFNFTGPSMAVDTMCSSSLTALHLACESLKNKECEVAFVGGVNLTIHPNKYLLLSFGKFASTDGRCRSFGKDGDGYVPGEGVGTVIIKPLDKAIEDKDQIYAIIKGTAINSGGKTSGFTVPSPVAQAEVIATAYEQAGISPESISYLETHGTGTSLGDPIEINGLNKVFETKGQKKVSCPIGSLKSNIGHLEGNSGLAGLMKVVLQMKYKKLVPSLHSDTLNPFIDFEHSPFYVQHQYEDWKEHPYLEHGKEKTERRAGVSCFGAGGSNAHVVLEEYRRKEEATSGEEGRQLYVFSAKNADRLKEYVTEYIEFLEQKTRKESCLEVLRELFSKESGIETLELNPEEDFEEYGILLAHCTTFQNWLVQERGIALDIHALQNIHTIAELAAYVDQQAEPDGTRIQGISGRSIAYLLQTGREAMEERLAIIADTLSELQRKLRNWIAGDDVQENVFHGNTLDYKERLNEMLRKEKESTTIDQLLEKQDMRELAVLWTAGAKIDWKKMYRTNCPVKISLPLYPFAKEHYWVKEQAITQSKCMEGMKLSPVLHQNTSDITGLKFTSTFTGEEEFLRDHVVNGEKILPAAVYMEMVRTAVCQLVPDMGKHQHIVLNNLFFMMPAKVEESGLQLVVKMELVSEGEFLFGIISKDQPQNVYCQGTAMVQERGEEDVFPMEKLAVLTEFEPVDGPTLYEQFAQQGICYGPYMQGIEVLYPSADKVIAKLNARNRVEESYYMNPVLLDSTLQAAVGFDGIRQMTHDKYAREGQQMALPFALEQIAFYAPCTKKMWAYLTVERKEEHSLEKINMLVIDESGKICAKLTNMAYRKPKNDIDSIIVNRKTTSIYVPVWKEELVSFRQKPLRTDKDRRVVLFTKYPECWTRFSSEYFQIIDVHEKQIGKEYADACKMLLRYVKRLSKENGGSQVVVQVVVQAGAHSILRGLSGFLASIHMENPDIITQFIYLDSDVEPAMGEQYLQEECNLGISSQVRYQDGIRSVKEFVPIEWQIKDREEGRQLLWKEQGIYLITGGAGGIGLQFVRQIVGAVKNAIVFLTGRSKRNVEEVLQQAGISPHRVLVKYVQCDVTDYERTKALVDSIQQSYGNVTGVIHTAGVIKDNLYIRKTEAEMETVFQPKMTALLNLKQAFGQREPQYWLLMSSSSAVKGNVGQTDYAAANGFLDQFAHLRSAMADTKEGAVYSINWPLWKEGGMQISETAEHEIEAATGMIPLETEEAFAMLEIGVAKKQTQFIPMEGQQERIEQWLNHKDEVQEAIEGTKNEEMLEGGANALTDEEQKQQKKALEEYLKKLLSDNMNLEAERIDVRMPLEEYGLTSIMTMELTAELEKEFGSLSKTLFFEYQSLRELAEYLYQVHFETVCKITGLNKKKQDAKKVAHMENKKIVSLAENTKLKPVVESKLLEKKQTKVSANGWDIAVIGLAGQYPCAENLDMLWENLKNGKDCITEITNERWNHDSYYDQDKTKMDKTYARWGGFLKDAECFDPLFFHISPMEAEGIDPQERLFLQCVYHAMEDAGYTKANISTEEKYGMKNNIGVFVGVMYEEYQLYGAQAQERGNFYTLNGSEASIANRVSYTYGFHGPSMSVDSMCSSSLSAMHLACRSILDGECNMAVAGGVNLSLHPNKFLMLGQSRFLSSDGRCHTFGEGGDGYVPGEGVGAVILKPLTKALEDGDHVYGVIKGSALNHGGKTNGYTVPNPTAQTGVILDAWRCAGVNPRAISYMEAHGTGTALGDPIEITGIQHAFDTVTKEKQFVALGSIKSNIGHCESAAGIAGITKILLQMKHKKLVPSLHSKTLNPNIHFNDSPCVVPQKLEEWKRPILMEHGVEKEYPLIAGISAFGAGGTNGHVMIEECMEERPVPENRREIPIFLLSARTKEQLEQKAKDFLKWIEHNQIQMEEGRITLTDIAYTLLTGRESMVERVAFFAYQLEELEEKLTQIVEGDYSGIYKGRIEKNSQLLEVFELDEDMEELVERWMEKGKYEKVMDLWIKGIPLDWQTYFSKFDYRKISLPGYPFAKNRCWRPDREKKPNEKRRLVQQLSPLIQQNTSDFTEQRYTSVFYGNEIFIEDHQVGGVKTLPAVVYLEMVYEAFLDAIHLNQNQKVDILFKDVLWSKPCTFKELQPKSVQVGFLPLGDAEAEFKVYSTQEGTDAKQQEIYCTGSIHVVDSEHKTVSVKELQGTDNLLIADKEKVYQSFEEIGIVYGTGQQSVVSLRKRENCVLAKLRLPEQLTQQMEGFTMYPAILDGALQAAIALLENSPVFVGGGRKKEQAAVPFMVKTITVHKNCQNEMWATLKATEDGMDKVNLELLDREGNVCISMDQIWYKPVKSQERALSFWSETEYPLAEAQKMQMNFQRRVLLLVGSHDNWYQKVRESGYWDECVPLVEIQQQDRLSLEECHHAFEQVFLAVKNEMSREKKVSTLIQVMIGVGRKLELLKGIAGIMKTLVQEHPSFYGQLLVVEKDTWKVEELNICEKYAYIPEIHLGKEQRAVSWKQLEPYSAIDSNPKEFLVEDGVYLITGGFGGLGKIFARELSKRKMNGKILLTGRSALDEEKLEFIREMKQYGATCCYYQTDVTDQKSVRELMTTIREKYGKLDGILHCAGVVKDSFLMKKTMDEFQSVLSPKLDGTWYLDEESREFDLKWFVLFSSFTAVTGNIGQADYAIANSFLDHFATFRNQLAKEGKRNGITLSINWPFWDEGGMVLDESSVNAMKERSGILPITAEEGIQAFYTALTLHGNAIAPLVGDEKKIATMFQMPKNKTVVRTSEENGQKQRKVLHTEEEYKERVTKHLISLFSEILMLDESQIEMDTIFEDYGIDSIFVMKITERMEKVFGALPKTLLFEYQTIETLAQYLSEEYKEPLETLCTEELDCEPEEKYPIEEQKQSLLQRRFKDRQKTELAKAVWEESKAEPEDEIAIIGIAGSYAQSEDLEELWENLKMGKDCVTEVPKERWDCNSYFNPDKDNVGTIYTKWGGYLKKVDEFDPLFFNISPSYAEIMDPQERIFLETAYHAFEDAGYTRKMLGYHPGGEVTRNVGVFVGVMNEEYQLYAAQEQAKGHPVIVSSNTSSVANRVSYFYDFHGPSMTIDTMCSSSLVAVHLACQAIREKDCEMALAGGVNVMIHPNKYLTISQSKFASTNGKCMSFGKGGDGYVPGEGTGALILKPKKKAIADGDHIYGLIKASSVNHGGKTSGYTVPNPNAQTEIIRTVLDKAGVNARELSYIEAHGTGTSLGDPIEIRALGKAFQSDTKEHGYCAIGSIKSNIGHCESASGVAAITKVLLQMKYKQLVPSIHAEELNPNIDFENSPFKVQRTLEEWKKPELIEQGVTRIGNRIAGISSFGAGGTNAHIILEEYEEPQHQTEEKEVLLIVSAKTENGLDSQVSRLKRYLQKHDTLSLTDISYTLLKGREALEYRMAFTASTVAEATKKLESYLERQLDEIYVKTEETDYDYGKEMKEIPKQLVSLANASQFDKLCKAWVSGIDLEEVADILLPEGRRISLPGYVFDQERYWIEILDETKEVQNVSKQARRKEWTLTKEDSFLRDHQVGMAHVLPGAAILEFARMTGEAYGKRPIQVIENTIWLRPSELLEIEPMKIQVELSEEQPYEFIVSDQNGVCAKGYVSTEKVNVPEIDIQVLQKMEQACSVKLDGEACYQYMNSVGLCSGTSFRVIKTVYANDKEAYAELSRPKDSDEQDDFILSPALLNGIFQSVMGTLRLDEGEQVYRMLPFALERMEIYQKMPSELKVYIQKQKVMQDSAQFAILIVDKEYKPVAYLDQFMLKAVNDKSQDSQLDAIEKCYYATTWQYSKDVEPVEQLEGECIWVFGAEPEVRQQIVRSLEDRTNQVVFVDSGEALKKIGPMEYTISYQNPEEFKQFVQLQKAENQMPNKIIFRGRGSSYAERMQDGIYAVFALSQALMEEKPEEEVRLLYAYTGKKNEVVPEYAGISGFAKTIQIENPLFHYKVVEFWEREDGKETSSIAKQLLEEFSYPDEETEVIYYGDRRMKKVMRKLAGNKEDEYDTKE